MFAYFRYLRNKFFTGVFPKRQGGRVPVRDGAQPSPQHQATRTDPLYAQVIMHVYIFFLYY